MNILNKIAAYPIKFLKEKDIRQEDFSENNVDWEFELGQDYYSNMKSYFGIKHSDIVELHKLIYKIGNDMLPEHIASLPRYIKPYNEKLAEAFDGFYFAAGLSRLVIIDPTKTFVIKLAINKASEHRVDSNGFEAENYLKFKNIFPKVYGHGVGAFGSDYDWLVVEYVYPLRAKDSIAIFSKNTLNLYFDIYRENATSITNIINLLKDLYQAYEGNIIPEEIYSYMKLSNLSAEDIYVEITKDPFIEECLRLSKETAFNLGDIRLENCGKTKDGKVVLIDIAPIWKNSIRLASIANF